MKTSTEAVSIRLKSFESKEAAARCGKPRQIANEDLQKLSYEVLNATKMRLIAP